MSALPFSNAGDDPPSPWVKTARALHLSRHTLHIGRIRKPKILRDKLVSLATLKNTLEINDRVNLAKI